MVVVERVHDPGYYKIIKIVYRYCKTVVGITSYNSNKYLIFLISSLGNCPQQVYFILSKYTNYKLIYLKYLLYIIEY